MCWFLSVCEMGHYYKTPSNVGDKMYHSDPVHYLLMSTCIIYAAWNEQGEKSLNEI